MSEFQPYLSLSDLIGACSRGGAAALTETGRLVAAAGEHAGIAPARYVGGGKSASTYAFETRFVDGERVRVVDLLSKAGAGNHLEKALADAIADQEDPLVRTPTAVVHYERDGKCSDIHDYDAPHRIFDGHFQAGTIGKEKTPDTEAFRRLRDTTALDARPLLETSPISLLLGAWDSTREKNQARWRSILTGEVIGVLADQTDSGTTIDPRGAARTDTFAPSVRLTPGQMRQMLDDRRKYLSPNNVGKIEKSIKDAKKGSRVSASSLGLGSIPPSLTDLGFVSCRSIIRSRVLSFATLRQIRFGGPEAADVAGRVLLAALGLALIARADEFLDLRANCVLAEADDPQVALRGRAHQDRSLGRIESDWADPLLAEAIGYAEKHADIVWDRQVFEVAGNPLIADNTVDDDDDAGAEAEK